MVSYREAHHLILGADTHSHESLKVHFLADSFRGNSTLVCKQE